MVYHLLIKVHLLWRQLPQIRLHCNFHHFKSYLSGLLTLMRNKMPSGTLFCCICTSDTTLECFTYSVCIFSSWFHNCCNHTFSQLLYMPHVVPLMLGKLPGLSHQAPGLWCYPLSFISGHCKRCVKEGNTVSAVNIFFFYPLFSCFFFVVSFPIINFHLWGNLILYFSPCLLESFLHFSAPSAPRFLQLFLQYQAIFTSLVYHTCVWSHPIDNTHPSSPILLLNLHRMATERQDKFFKSKKKIKKSNEWKKSKRSTCSCHAASSDLSRAKDEPFSVHLIWDLYTHKQNAPNTYTFQRTPKSHYNLCSPTFLLYCFVTRPPQTNLAWVLFLLTCSSEWPRVQQ